MSETRDRPTVVEAPGSRGADVGASPATHLERVTVRLTLRSVRALANVVRWTGHNRTDVLNRAMQVYEFVRQVTENGGSVYVRRSPCADLERVSFY
jgi:hypothetical protein